MQKNRSSAEILVLDDRPENLKVVVELLGYLGYQHVRGISDPRAALDAVTGLRVDLLLLDLQMPEMDGYEILRRIRESGTGDTPPVVILTADATLETRQKCLDLGATDVVTKPFEATDLALRISRLLATKN